MTKDVLVSISGLQMAVNDVESNDDGPIEILSAGTYFFKDGTHYIFFEEVVEGVPQVTKTQIRIKGTESLEVIKKGITNTHMIFEHKKNNRCYYRTPYGQLNLGIYTGKISVDETEESIEVKAEYVLDVDYEPLAECNIRVHIMPRGSKSFSIMS